MANEIKLITFADSEVTATDDAYVYETATGAGGIINGSVVTIKSASELHITGGNGILCGRKFTIYDSDIPVTLSASGSLLGRLYIHMDLSNASDPITLEVETGASLTPCVQDADVNATNGIYEVNLATFDVDTSTISNLVDVAPKTGPHTVLNTIEDCVASTNPNDIAGASCISLLNSNIAKNDLDANVDLSSYTSLANAYVAPTDGYINFGLASNSTLVALTIFVVSASANSNALDTTNARPSSGWNNVTLFVKKGMRIYCGTVPDSRAFVNFRKLI